MLSPDEIRYLRERLDLTQKEFMAVLGYPDSSHRMGKCRQWEAGDAVPPWPYIRHMRTLNAVANGMMALKMGRNGLAINLLEDVFELVGARSFTEQEIEHMRVNK